MRISSSNFRKSKAESKSWKQNCDQVQEFDFIISEKDQEFESLKRELETKSATMELPVQLSTGLPVGTRGTIVDGYLPTTIGLQSATLLHPVKASPSSGTSTTLSQVTCSFVLLTLSHHTKIPTVSLSSQGGRMLTSVWTPQTVPYSARPMVQVSETNPTVTKTVPLFPIAEPPVAPLPTLLTGSSVQRRGKAPPIDSFNGEDSEILFDDWLLTLERAANWNGWTEDERLMQLAGCLHGRALQEWDLISPAECQTYQSSTAALKVHLDPGNKMLAALDFRHITQKETENVYDFIRRFKSTFQVAFGRALMSRDVLLYVGFKMIFRLILLVRLQLYQGHRVIRNSV